MAFKKPESFDGLTLADLRTLNDEALAEGRALAAKGLDLTDAEIAEAEALMTASAEIEAEIARAEQAEADRAARITALQEGLAPAAEDGDEDDEDDDDTDDDGDEDGDGDADDEDESADAEAQKEVVVASAPTKTVSSAKRRAKAPAAPVVEEEEETPAPRATLVAAANVPGVIANDEFADMLAVAAAFKGATRGYAGSARGDKPRVLGAGVYGLSDRHQRFGLAHIRKPESEFTLTERMSAQDQFDMVIAASKESRLPGGSLVAAGGWCAPSEILYGFCELETVSGLLSLPEVQARRGGIQFTKGPDYATLAATWGFLQTETQAEAGTEKVCYEIDCPDWTEVRLDAIGFCVTAPVLTNAAFPELINRVLQIGAVAHAHKVNASLISRISTLIGTAINWSEVGGSTSDVLDAAELTAERIRYTYSMAPGTTVEAVFPVWAKGAIRADVGRRLNIDNPLNVTDAAINSWFAVRGIAVQWVYDYQPLSATTPAFPASAPTATWTAWPTSVEFMMWPAGAYTKLAKDVIDLDTIYDSVGLSTNVYSAAFFEEGIAVANTCGAGVKVQVALNTKGSTGFPAVGAGAGVTYASA